MKSLTVPFHAVIQDGASTDRTLEIAQELVGDDDRFQIVSEPDVGQADALNRAWQRLAPDHPYLTWINADDVLHPHGFSQALELAEQRPDTSGVYGAFLIIDEDGHVIEFIRRPPRLRRIDLLYVDSLVPGIAAICRTSAVQDAGMFDTNLRYALDHDLFIRLSRFGSLRGVPQPTFSFRQHAGSKTTGVEADRSRAEAQEVSQAHRRLSGVAADGLRALLRARYRAMKTVGAWMPNERFGDQQAHTQ